MRETLKNYRVKITVLQKLFHEELVEKHASNPASWTPCTHFEVGDTFYTDAGIPWAMPEGFCGWAWADMQKLVYGMVRGGQERFVTCCTDGYRPVLFLLERVEE